MWIELLKKSTFPALICDSEGNILEKNGFLLGNEFFKNKETLLEILGEPLNFSEFFELIPKTYLVQDSKNKSQQFKLQIIPYTKNKKSYYFVSLLFLDKIPVNQNKSIEASNKSVIRNKNVIFYELLENRTDISFSIRSVVYSIFYSYFEKHFTNIYVREQLGNHDKVYGNSLLFKRLFSTIKKIINLVGLKKQNPKITLDKFLEREQITINLVLKYSPQKKTIIKKIFALVEKQQKDIIHFESQLKITLNNDFLIILLIFKYEPRVENYLKVLLIDSSKKDLYKMENFVKRTNQPVEIVKISDFSRVAKETEKNYDVIIVDPVFPKYKFIPKFFSYLNIFEKINFQNFKDVNILAVGGKILSNKMNNLFTMDYHLKPYAHKTTQVKINRFFHVSQRIKKLFNYIQKIKYFSYVDSLTDLYNRRYFDDFTKRLIEESSVNNKSFSLFVLDIDYFKNYNDTCGHLFGDLILKKIAASIKISIRKTDIAIRYGGEEFIVLALNLSSKDGYFIAEKIRSYIEKEYFEMQEKQPKKNLTISIGCSSFPKDATKIKDLFNIADKRLYEAKNKGRNCVV